MATPDRSFDNRVRVRFRAARSKPFSPYYDLPTFCDHGPDHRTAKLHRYTACYLPELAARIIRRHSQPEDTVLDGFLGGGTTAIQAVANGRCAQGVDVHPAAIEIARARLAPVFPKALERTIERIKRCLKHGRPSSVDLPADPGGWEWDRWFPRQSHPVLSLLRRVITDTPRSDVRRLLLVATAGALKQVSYWYSHATKLQFDPTKVPPGVKEVMLPRLDEARKINQELWEHVGGFTGVQKRCESASLEVGDCCALPFANDSADLAVSSPPYFIAYDYAKLLRMSSWWILGRVPDGCGHVETAGRGKPKGHEPPAELGNEFRRLFNQTARKRDAKGAGNSPSHVGTLLRSIGPFFDGMRRSIAEVHRVLRPHGKFCLVLGNTRHCGVTIRTAEISAELALRQGFHVVAVHIRRQHSATQPQTRGELGQFTSEASPHQYTYRDEYVIVLRKS